MESEEQTRVPLIERTHENYPTCFIFLTLFTERGFSKCFHPENKDAEQRVPKIE